VASKPTSKTSVCRIEWTPQFLVMLHREPPKLRDEVGGRTLVPRTPSPTFPHSHLPAHPPTHVHTRAHPNPHNRVQSHTATQPSNPTITETHTTTQPHMHTCTHAHTHMQASRTWLRAHTHATEPAVKPHEDSPTLDTEKWASWTRKGHHRPLPFA
jgi:hypothetical protein